MDYRNTQYCKGLVNVMQLKNTLESKIKEEHKRVKIIYNMVKAEYKGELGNIYNYKCAYCGASVRFTDSNLFEVDHYINEASFPKTKAGRMEAGKLSNLIFSCYICNRGKGSFQINAPYDGLLHPDKRDVLKVFYRDVDYYIKINPEYQDDRTICGFYDALQLGFQVRRLNHLLNEMQGVYDNLPAGNAKNSLGDLIRELIEKKNITSNS